MAGQLDEILGQGDIARIMSSASNVASRLGSSVSAVLFLSALAQEAGSVRERMAETVPSSRLYNRYGTLMPRLIEGDDGLEVSVQRPYLAGLGVCTVAGVFKHVDGSEAAPIRVFVAYLLRPAFGAAGMYPGSPPGSFGL